jgi:hypothetical protein
VLLPDFTAEYTEIAELCNIDLFFSAFSANSAVNLKLNIP